LHRLSLSDRGLSGHKVEGGGRGDRQRDRGLGAGTGIDAIRARRQAHQRIAALRVRFGAAGRAGGDVAGGYFGSGATLPVNVASAVCAQLIVGTVSAAARVADTVCAISDRYSFLLLDFACSSSPNSFT